jgi:hypothetical protein
MWSTVTADNMEVLSSSLTKGRLQAGGLSYCKLIVWDIRLNHMGKLRQFQRNDFPRCKSFPRRKTAKPLQGILLERCQEFTTRLVMFLLYM